MFVLDGSASQIQPAGCQLMITGVAYELQSGRDVSPTWQQMDDPTLTWYTLKSGGFTSEARSKASRS